MVGAVVPLKRDARRTKWLAQLISSFPTLQYVIFSSSYITLSHEISAMGLEHLP
jgi:hypothetical protein